MQWPRACQALGASRPILHPQAPEHLLHITKLHSINDKHTPFGETAASLVRPSLCCTGVLVLSLAIFEGECDQVGRLITVAIQCTCALK
eukprot:5481456-Amphidinium_carterae.1